MEEAQVTFTVLLLYTIINPHYAKKPVATIVNGDKLCGYAIFGAWNHNTDGHPLRQGVIRDIDINKIAKLHKKGHVSLCSSMYKNRYIYICIYIHAFIP